MHYKLSEDLLIWHDHMPHLGLPDETRNMLLDEKKKILFGANTIDKELSNITDNNFSIVFDHYLNLNLSSKIEKIFFPGFFLSCCMKYSVKQTCKKTISTVCPMNKSRFARILASCWLYNQNQQIDFLYSQMFDSDKHSLDTLYELLQVGGLKDWKGVQGPTVNLLPKKFFKTYKENSINFDDIFDILYAEAASVIVLEPVFWEHGSIITEKYLQAVLAKSVPLINGYNVYNSLSKLGFDVFDDIIDTSSQYEKNPVLAVWNLLEKNKDFFYNSVDIVNNYPQIQQRLQNNIDLVTANCNTLYKNSVQNLNNSNAIENFLKHKNKILIRENLFDQFQHIKI